MKNNISFDKETDIAIICEGNSERHYISILLKNKLLKFSKNQLIGSKPLGKKYRAKTNFRDEFLTMSYDKPISIIQIQDDQRLIKINSPYDIHVGQHLIVRTRPEIEMLMVHHFDLYNEYIKEKSTSAPSKFLADYLQESVSTG